MMKKKDKAIVTLTTITGQIDNVTCICNLSSVPQWAMAMITNRFVDSKRNITTFSIQAQMTYDTIANERVNQYKRKKEMHFMIDADDKNIDNKIKNICFMNNWKMAGRIVVMEENSVNKSSNTVGRIGVRIASHHHTKQMMTTLMAKQLISADVNSLINATLVKTNDDRCGSVAGLTHILASLSIPFIVDMCKVAYIESWIATGKLLNKCSFDVTTTTSDVLPDGDKGWQNKLGYGDLVMTDKGIKRMKIKIINKKNKSEKRNNMLTCIFNFFKNCIAYIKGFFFNNAKETDMKQADKVNTQTKQKTINVKKQGKNKKVKTKLAFGYMGALNVTASIAMMYNRSYRLDASKDIRKANKILSDMQLSKMQSKTGIIGDKSLASMKRSDAFNAYIVSTTSYNVTDATTTANQLAVKRRQKLDDNSLLIFTLIAIIISVVAGNSLIALIAGSIGLIAFIIKHINRLSAVMLVTALCSANIYLIMFAIIVALVEELSLNKDTEMIRSLFYIVTSCLIII